MYLVELKERRWLLPQLGHFESFTVVTFHCPLGMSRVRDIWFNYQPLVPSICSGTIGVLNVSTYEPVGTFLILSIRVILVTSITDCSVNSAFIFSKVMWRRPLHVTTPLE